MKYEQYQEDLNKILESEIFGEALFKTAAKHTKSEAKQQKWLTLTALESQTLHRLEVFLQANQLQASSRFHIKAQGVALGYLLSKLPWSVAMYLVKDGTQPFMQVFERLCAHADQDSKLFFEYVLNHEKSIHEFANRELKNRESTSLEMVLELLDQPKSLS
ncbi:hypothetical protein [Acinetobacter piscicola]|uniref:hypothetical protein n=1 Tax=Acinetobacter piscicola TaxID=2006115 RepID=UPI000B7CD251|nr:hypothetical protein [Acinetobacter piscicola]